MSITFWRCLARTVPALGGVELFPGNSTWILVFAQTEKNRLAQFSVARPLIRSPPASSPAAHAGLTVYVAASPLAPFS
jgi:hypothetical protein